MPRNIRVLLILNSFPAPIQSVPAGTKLVDLIKAAFPTYERVGALVKFDGKPGVLTVSVKENLITETPEDYEVVHGGVITLFHAFPG